MVKIKILLLTVIFFLSACSFVEVQDYVHEPTQDLLESIIHSGHQEIEGAEGREFVIVPDFSTFSSSYSINKARLIIVSESANSISIKEARLLNTSSGDSKSIDLHQQYEVSSLVPGTGFYLSFVSLWDENFVSVSSFNKANELELIVSYSTAGSELKTETMILKLVARKEIAWIT